MDINLTGQIAATLAENLKTPWYNALLYAGAAGIGGLVTGLITLLGVGLSDKHAEQRALRKERKEVYETIISFKLRTDLIAGDQTKAKIASMEFNKFVDKMAELELLNPEIGTKMDDILKKLPTQDPDYLLKNWSGISGISKQLQDEIIPLMQNDLKANEFQWRQFWK
jgi:hypothetical protein